MRSGRIAELVFAMLVGLAADVWAAEPAEKVLRAGAASVSIAPPRLPAIINGGFLEQRADAVRDPLHARGLVLDDGSTRLAIVVVDSCMLPRDLIDRAKRLAHERTGLAEDRMLVSATHTHSAPAAMGALGSRPDEAYVAFLPEKIAEVIARASASLTPAEVGWAVTDDFDHTHCRQWIRRPDRMLTDPFGGRTVRSNMHPGYENPDVIGPSGPVDPALSVLAVRTRDGRPLAVLANYSMHYFGASPVSADYFGRFAEQLGRLIGGGDNTVVMMSQGTSGDQHWMDYARPKDSITIDAYAEAVARRALGAYESIAYRPWVALGMVESRLTLRRRVPGEARLAWARPIVEAMGDRAPKNQQEVYAREALFLHAEPERELKLQAIKIGTLGIAAIPDEVFALSGLKIKAQSPLDTTFVIELANGSEGYIPPPEHHPLGGYTTWPARTAALEVQAEPKIVAAVLGLLEEVSGRSRRPIREPAGESARAVQASRPLAYWRLDEMTGPEAADATGHANRASYEGNVVFYLEGVPSDGSTSPRAINRAAHFAGGHLAAEVPDAGPACSMELWFWNGLPNAVRDVTGVLLASGTGDAAERLVIAGTRGAAGRLEFSGGKGSGLVLAGTREIPPKTWHHVVLVRDGDAVAVYLDGAPEIQGRGAEMRRGGAARWLMGGGIPDETSFEGKLDEVAIYDRSLTPDDVAEHHRIGRGRP
jgi:hypothetical protein